MLLRRVPTHEDWEEGYESRRTPNHREHDNQFTLGHYERIVERLYNGVVSVYANTTKVEYGHCREVNVQRIPDVTHEVAEQPPSGRLDTEVEAHGPDGDEHVGQGEGHNEVVGDDAELAVAHDADDDEEVAEEGGHDDEAHDRGLEGERGVGVLGLEEDEGSGGGGGVCDPIVRGAAAGGGAGRGPDLCRQAIRLVQPAPRRTPTIPCNNNYSG